MSKLMRSRFVNTSSSEILCYGIINSDPTQSIRAMQHNSLTNLPYNLMHHLRHLGYEYRLHILLWRKPRQNTRVFRHGMNDVRQEGWHLSPRQPTDVI